MPNSRMGEVKESNATIEDAPFPLTDTDRWVLSQTDEEFHLHDWDELKQIIGKWVLRIHFPLDSWNTYSWDRCPKILEAHVMRLRVLIDLRSSTEYLF